MLTTPIAHLAILTSVVANIITSAVGYRILTRKINGKQDKGG